MKHFHYTKRDHVNEAEVLSVDVICFHSQLVELENFIPEFCLSIYMSSYINIFSQDNHEMLPRFFAVVCVKDVHLISSTLTLLMLFNLWS